MKEKGNLERSKAKMKTKFSKIDIEWNGKDNWNTKEAKKL